MEGNVKGKAGKVVARLLPYVKNNIGDEHIVYIRFRGEVQAAQTQFDNVYDAGVLREIEGNFGDKVILEAMRTGQ